MLNQAFKALNETLLPPAVQELRHNFTQHWDKLAFPAQQRWLALQFWPWRLAISTALQGQIPQISLAEMQHLQTRYNQLLQADLDNVEQGLYPRDLLYQFPLLNYLPRLGQLFGDMFNVWQRASQKRHDDVPAELKDNFPAYYTRNFHWQSDGYFSQHSAQIYDASVELLFLGTADIMRRQCIPPLTRYIQQERFTNAAGQKPLRLLDLACGTGRTLLQMAQAHPQLHYTGLDLSQAYLDEAQHNFKAHQVQPAWVQGNGEALPFENDSFDILSCVYLFHELPRDVRRRVLAEMARVLKPGGLLLLMDSAQLSDSPEMKESLARFPKEYHEPYYKDYIRDDLETALQDQGFSPPEVSSHYLSKLFVAQLL